MSRDVVFIHGMFVTPRCWDGWIPHFRKAGYRPIAPAWPFHDGTAEELRARHPDSGLGGLTLSALVTHFEGILRGFSSPPILVGHSMGGLLVQLLLQRGLGSAGVAIDSAPPNGVSVVSWSFLRSNWPVVSPFVDKNAPVLLSKEQFAYAFVHDLPEEQQRAIYEAHVVPESRLVGRGPLSDAAAIDFEKPHAPLLLVAGQSDKIIPASLNRKNYARYKDAKSVTELKVFPNRTHNLIAQEGWTEIADYALGWLERLPRAAPGVSVSPQSHQP
ncbi:MAG: alpha/beta hydrolase [Polyangiaceae bacterium]